MAHSNDLLEIRDLRVKYKSSAREITALRDVNLSVKPSEIVAIVGESGCGKSTLGLSIINLLPTPPAVVESGQILFKGTDLLKIRGNEIANMRGTSISMIFQEPMSSLDPVYTVGYQVSEAIHVRESRKRTNSYGPFKRDAPPAEGTDSGLRRMLGVQLPKSRRSRRYSDEAVEALRKVQIADPERVLDKYPHELSGGMAQRVMIAQALTENPAILIADEPTSALDVTTQAQVLKLVKELRDEIGSSIIMITHDLAVAAQIADRVAVMYAGELVEIADANAIFEKPLHPYTEGLIGSFPNKYKNEGVLTDIPGDVPRLDFPPTGCTFHPRCKYAFGKCQAQHPTLLSSIQGRKVACFLRNQN